MAFYIGKLGEHMPQYTPRPLYDFKAGSVGRPRKFKDAKQLQDALKRAFKWHEQTPVIEKTMPSLRGRLLNTMQSARV